MSPAYVPAVDNDGDELWLDDIGRMANVGSVVGRWPAAGWRRLYVLAEPAAFEPHPDLIDRQNDRWTWGGDGYYLSDSRALGRGVSRASIERDYGPVAEVTP